ncbi:MAG: hypothetical protein R3B70_43575 [Polyangiaceae bacterium]
MKAAAVHTAGVAHAAKALGGGSPRGGAFNLLDAEALLVALTLSPATYSRNRFYEMYTSPVVQRSRRRAGQIRSIVTALVSDTAAKGSGRLISVEPDAGGGAVMVYDVPSLGMRRTVRLSPIEVALVRYCVGRARGESAPAELVPHASDSEQIGLALQRLSPLPA